MRNFILTSIFALVTAAILAFCLRGIPGNPTSDTINQDQWKDEGPFELSPERGRFALTISLIENHSFQFSIPIARFATPDLGYKNGRYVSLFAPLVSFLIIPGYYVGHAFGFGQVGTYAIIALFALFNVLLIRSIAIRLGAHPLAASITAVLFLIGTPALPYAVSLYQHHFSVFLLLLSIYLLVRSTSFFSLQAIWFLIALSLPLDYPNIIFMLPIGIAALGRLFIKNTTPVGTTIKFKLLGLLTFCGVIVPFSLFLAFNTLSYGHPLTLLSSLSQVKDLNADGTITSTHATNEASSAAQLARTSENRSAIGFFQSRSLLRGLSILFASLDRGVLVFAPIVLFGLIGIYLMYVQKEPYLQLLISILGLNLLLYGMWGDPWGGWAFGPRYLIPAFSILSITSATALSHWRKNLLFMSLFTLVASYSIMVNMLGAITSNRNPPEVEIANLAKLSGRQERFSWDRNLEYLEAGKSKSVVFQTFAKDYVTAWDYYRFLTAFVIGITGGMLVYLSRLPETHPKYE